MRISHAMIIRRPPSAVFSWIADPATAARWQPDIAEYEITREMPGVVGTTFRERLGDSSGSMEMRGQVVAYETGRLIAFDLRGRGIHVKSRYAVRPYGAATDLIVDLEIRILGPLTRLLEPFVRPRFERQVTADLERLRVMCESEAAAATTPVTRSPRRETGSGRRTATAVGRVG